MENEFADHKIAVETENGDNSECVSTETSVDTDSEKHSEFDPEHSVEMDNENSHYTIECSHRSLISFLHR